MMRVLLSILIICFFYSCTKESRESTLPRSTDTLSTYLALGDSYTIGQSVDKNERFPAQTVALLKQQGINIAEPVYIAQTGWTTLNLQQAIAAQNPAPNYDIVSLLIGVNDQYQGVDTGTYALHFTQLLEKAIQLAKGKKSRVFVLSIPDYSITPFVSAGGKQRVKKEIDWFNEINKRITTSYEVSYTDITPSSRAAENNAALLANDKLHPSGQEYKKWAALLAPKVKAALK